MCTLLCVCVCVCMVCVCVCAWCVNGIGPIYVGAPPRGLLQSRSQANAVLGFHGHIRDLRFYCKDIGFDAIRKLYTGGRTIPMTITHIHSSSTSSHTSQILFHSQLMASTVRCATDALAASLPTKVRLGTLLKHVDEKQIISVFQWNHSRDTQV